MRSTESDFENLDAVVERNSLAPTVICLDLFGFQLSAVTFAIGSIRDRYPKAVFNLYLDHPSNISRQAELPDAWQSVSVITTRCFEKLQIRICGQ